MSEMIRTPAEPAPTKPHSADPVQSKRKSKLPLIIGAAVVATFAGVVAWKIYVPTADAFTDDARITAHYTTVAPRISGQIAYVGVQDNQFVHAGQLLATIDDRDYRAAVDRAEAQLLRDRAQVDDALASVDRQPDVIAQEDAQVRQIEARLSLAQFNATRYRNLAESGSGSRQDTQTADSTLMEAKAELVRSKAAVSAARHQLDLLKARHDAALATVKADEAALVQAQLNLGYTRITAPVDGVVGARSVEQGNFVNPGSALMALVPREEVYVEAHYREVALKHMEPGQQVRVHVDAYDIDLDAVVDSVPPATGGTFAPIAPDNATGNFTKIVQRLPVKIVFAPNQPQVAMLRLGMSVETTVKTNFADVMAKGRDTYHRASTADRAHAGGAGDAGRPGFPRPASDAAGV